MTLRACTGCGTPTSYPRCPRCTRANPPARNDTGNKAYRRNREAALRRDDYTCQTCGAPATEADHILPVSKGGGHDLTNLRASCLPCNRRRGNRPTP